MKKAIEENAAAAVKKANARKEIELNEPTDTRKERYE